MKIIYIFCSWKEVFGSLEYEWIQRKGWVFVILTKVLSDVLSNVLVMVQFIFLTWVGSWWWRWKVWFSAIAFPLLFSVQFFNRAISSTGNLKKDTTDIRELETHFESREYFSGIFKRRLCVVWMSSRFRSYNPPTPFCHTFLHGRVLTDYIDIHIYLWE